MRVGFVRGMAWLCLLATVASALIACSDKDKPTAVNVTDIATSAEETDDGLYHDDVPTVNYDGYVFRVYSRDDAWFNGNITVEAQNGEVINDAIFIRNAKVCDRFNIQITETVHTDTELARATVLANEDAYDMINARCTAALSMAVEGILYTVEDLPYVDLSKPYWDEKLTDDVNIGPYRYFAVGDLNLTFYDYTSVLLFNKQIVEDNTIENPYQIVYDNRWTFDKYMELAMGVTTDLNGDSKLDQNDMYGIIGTPNFVGYTLTLAAGVKSVNKDEDNYPVYNLDSDEKFIEVFNKVFEVMWDSNTWFRTTITDQISPTFVSMFKNNQSLFFSTNFFNVPSLRDMDTEFGILPFPKYNENQEKYITRISFFDMFTVPITVSDLDRTSAIIEVLNCESGNIVIPAYYEISLKTKYARDNDSSGMLDLIMEHRVVDLGDTIWVGEIRDGWLAAMYQNNNRNIASTAKKYSRLMSKTIEKVVTSLETNALR
ncbi:MAG: hypothetical protein ACOYID_06070 [Eubacteriales bacterium]|jgi:hypothetical protein|nr:hypothetical protein [Clostridiales bacterium]